MNVVVRPGRPDEAEELRTIERLAGEQFRDVGLSDVADHEPASAEILAAYATAGRAWVGVDETDAPVGYVIVDIVDGNAHIEQMSVRPDSQGAGVGRALIDVVRSWAERRAITAITLTTFARVPWNGPLYEHLGFTSLQEHSIGPELRAVRDAETAHGLDPATRVCMQLDIERSAGD